MSLRAAAVDQPTYRAIPSQFPPIGAFDAVSAPEDLEAVMELEGWTNDRLVRDRLQRLPRGEWVFGIPNASVVMASFLHPSPVGSRFNGNLLGAWYSAYALRTAIKEVAHHLRREAHNTGVQSMQKRYRVYTAALAGSYGDMRGLQAHYPAELNPKNHGAGQIFGETARANGEAGLIYDSLRDPRGTNVVAFRPGNITDITQGDHYEVTVPLKGKATARKLTG